ncbi:hypothetical protein Tco_0026500, partial [Tanacetum coccineum]
MYHSAPLKVQDCYRDVDGILDALNEFYNSSDLKINVEKSNMYGVGVSLDEITNMAASTGCAAGNLPFNYLGITIGASIATKGRWDSIVKRFKNRLSKWEANMLSVGGREKDSMVAWEKVIAEKERALWCNVIKSIHVEYEGLDSREISRVKIEIIIIISDNNSNLESTNGISSSDTSSQDIVSSKGPSRQLLKWYDDTTDEDIPEFKFSKQQVQRHQLLRHQLQ